MLSKIPETYVISRLDPRFPPLLREAANTPSQLYIKGVLPPVEMPLITVVGTRRITTYGKRMVEGILSPLIRFGFGIVSGLAFGIDAEAHELALRLGGYTAAVLGSGIEDITPHQHEPLARRMIAAGGGIISELPGMSEIHRGSFPRRNRILAAMSPMTVVIEAAQKSGALITAHHAVEYSRDVGAVPGSVFSDVSTGCHSLLKKGAYLITSAEDILEIYKLAVRPTEQRPLPSLSADEQEIWRLLTQEPQPIDVLAQQVSLPMAQILRILTSLEIAGEISHIPGQGYAKA